VARPGRDPRLFPQHADRGNVRRHLFHQLERQILKTEAEIEMADDDTLEPCLQALTGARWLRKRWRWQFRRFQGQKKTQI